MVSELLKKPSDFAKIHPWSSIFGSSESETVARNVMTILSRTGNNWRTISLNEYIDEREKDGNLWPEEIEQFNQVSRFCISPELAAQFSHEWFVIWHDERSIPSLLKFRGNWEDVEEATNELRYFSYQKVLPHLLEALKCPEEVALNTARYFPDDALIEPLANMLIHPEAFKRLLAAVALEQIGGGQVRGIAEVRLQHENDNDVREILESIVETEAKK